MLNKPVKLLDRRRGRGKKRQSIGDWLFGHAEVRFWIEINKRAKVKHFLKVVMLIEQSVG